MKHLFFKSAAAFLSGLLSYVFIQTTILLLIDGRTVFTKDDVRSMEWIGCLLALVIFALPFFSETRAAVIRHLAFVGMVGSAAGFVLIAFVRDFFLAASPAPGAESHPAGDAGSGLIYLLYLVAALALTAISLLIFIVAWIADRREP